MGAQLVQAGEHDRQRLVRPALAPLEPAHRLAVGGVAGQVEAAEPLHREDLTAAQQLGGGADGGGGVVRLAFGKSHDPAALRTPHQPHPRPTRGARVGLGVKAPVGRVFVLGPAGRAEREAPHRGALPVVGQVLDDRESWTAVCAIGEGILKAPIARIEELGAALVARRDVRRDELVGVGVHGAREDAEGRGAFELGRDPLERGDVGTWRRLARQGLDERVDVGRRAFRHDLDAG